MPSPKNARKHQKAVARKKSKRPRPSPKDPRSLKPHEIATWAARIAKWPLRVCIVSEWIEHRKQGIVVIARDGAQGDVAGALFLVDLGCMGLRNAIRIGPEAPETFEKWLDGLPLRDASRAVEPSEALAILEVAREGAAALGFAPPGDVAALLPLFGATDPEAAFEVPTFGWGGKPLYIEWEDDNAARILGQLTDRVGCDGFSHVSIDNVVRVALSSEDASSADLATRLARCGELKSMLDLIARFGPYLEERAHYSISLQRIVRESDEDLPDFELNDAELQSFLYGYRDRDGVSVPEAFLREEPRLTTWDRSVIETWTGMFGSIFRVVEHGDDHAVWESLIDQNRYELRHPAGASVLHALPVGSFVRAWITPFEHCWLSTSTPVPVDDEAYAYELAGAMAYMNPRLLFRSEPLLEAGWRMQKEEGQDFEAFFGAREVRIPSNELGEKIKAWTCFRHDRVAERTPAGEVTDVVLVDLDEPELPDELPDDVVGVLHSDTWGMCIVGGYGKLEDLFRDPSLVESEEHMDLLDEYVQDASSSPLPFEIVCGRYPEGASKVFSAYLEEADFDWGSDGAELLRDIKKEQYDRGPLPRTRPMPPALVEGVKRARKDVEAP